MKHILKTIGALFRIKLSGSAVYRLSFFTAFFVDSVTFLVQMVFLRLITASAVTEWSSEMYTVFIGSFTALDGLWMTTWFFGLISLPDMIRDGRLDLVLLRPVDPLMYVTFSSFDIGSIPVILLGTVITFGAAATGGFLTVGNALLWALSIILMNALMYALSLILRSCAFWSTKGAALAQVENVMVESSMRLPLPAIKGMYRAALLLALPYGMAANFPTLVLAGQATALSWLYAVALTAAFLALGIMLWRKGLRRYESASS